MSNKKVNAGRVAARDAISAERLESLLRSVSPALVNPEESQRRNEEDKRQKEIASLSDQYKFDKTSAEVLLNNLWIRPYIEQARQANAKVTNIKESGGVVLSIKAYKDESDRAKVKVSKGGDFQIVQEAQREILQQTIAKLFPQPGRNNLTRIANNDRFENR